MGTRVVLFVMENIVSDSSQRALPVTFSSFIVSLAGSAMMHLGEAPHPGTGEPQTNLALARNTIDLLSLMQDKTKGNLDEEEKGLLNTLVVELNSKYDALNA